MIRFIAFVAMRLLVTVFFLLTSAYSILNYTPFVFNQFLRPRLFGWVNAFVASHHLWYCGAYVISVVTLLPDLKRPPPGDRARVTARRLALAYVVVFGLVAEWLVVTPYLPKLWNDERSLVAALLSFLPLLWLAVIDHVASRPDRFLGEHARTVTDQRRLFVTALTAAEYVWAVHLIHATRQGAAGGGTLAWTVMACWTQALNLAAAMGVYAVLSSISALSACTRAPRLCEYCSAAVLAAIAIAALLLKVAFPNLAFGEYPPIAMALVAGVALAMTWSSAAVRRPHEEGAPFLSGLDLFVAPLVPAKRSWIGVLVLAILPLPTFAAIAILARTDWNFVIQKAIVVAEWVLVFGFVFGASRRLSRRPWSPMRAVAPVALALVLLVASVRVFAYLPVWTGNPRLEAEVVSDRYAGVDLSFKLLYDGLVQHPGRDAQFNRYLQANTNVSHGVALTPPDVRFSDGPGPAPQYRPHVFVFVLDSLRRDYLAPFNPRVTFTPHMTRFASESFTFDNAFSQYGGTSLAVPSIWSGGLVIHRTSMPNFPRSNALEKLMDGDGYQWFMSLDSVMAPILGPHPDLIELDRGRKIMEFDLCKTFEDLEGKLDARTGTRPVFAFSLPQNLHISKRQYAPVPPGELYPGFFAPYAAEVHRLDGCFGEFVSYLKRKGLFDDSVIVLTTDHGDSLGEGGNWGHNLTLYPEVVRIPLVIHVPTRLRPELTTDLARVAFSTDIVPTLYRLLRHEPRDLGPLYGSPLFVSRHIEPAPRRRQSFLLASSYAATYGILRRNGRSLYIADLVNGREYVYQSTTERLDARVQVTDDVRRAGQRLIRERLAALAELYHFEPAP